MLTREQLVARIETLVYRLAGRHYEVDFKKLDDDSLRELIHLLHDLHSEGRRSAL